MKTLVVFFLFIVPAISLAQQDGSRLALQTLMTCESVSRPADSATWPGAPVRRAHSAVNIGGQVLLGATFSVLFSIPSLYAIGLAVWNENSAAGEIGLSLFYLSSYSFGTAAGVHVIADQENPEHSLWKTWMYSAIGTGIEFLSLPFAVVERVAEYAERFNPDFDGACQYAIAEEHGLTMASFDSDFDRTDRKRKTPSRLM